MKMVSYTILTGCLERKQEKEGYHLLYFNTYCIIIFTYLTQCSNNIIKNKNGKTNQTNLYFSLTRESKHSLAHKEKKQ